MSHTSFSGREPRLGGDDALDLTGFEPLLGGARRAGADMGRIQALLDAPSGEERHRLLAYVARLGQTSLYAQELAQIVPARARQRVGNWRGSFTPGQRCAAMDALAEIGGTESIVPLLEALDDAVFEVRQAAGRALTAICGRLPQDDRRTKIVYRALVEALRTPALSGRKVVARILAAAPPDLVLGPLLREGLKAQEWGARREAAWVLGALGDQRATRRLVAALGDPSAAVRGAAAWALGRLDAPVVIAPLSGALDDPDEVVRAAVIEALSAQAVRLSPDDEAFVPTLALVASGLQDPDISVRHATREALTALAAIPDARRALRALIGASPSQL